MDTQNVYYIIILTIQITKFDRKKTFQPSLILTRDSFVDLT